MPDSTLSALPAAGTLDGNEIYYTVQNGVDRKVGGFQLKRTLLTASTTYYVSPAGVDTIAGGTAAAPWATLQYAIDHIANYIDVGNHNITIQLAAGTVGSPNIYAGIPDLPSISGGGIISIESSDGDPTHTTISDTVGPACIFARTNSTTQFGIGGVTLTSTVGPLIWLDGDIQFSIGTTVCPSITLGAPGTSKYMIVLDDHATFFDGLLADSIVTLSPNATGCSGYINALRSADAIIGGAVTYTITGTPAWGGAFLRADFGATMDVDVSTSFNVTGASTGNQLVITANASINSQRDPAELPGTTGTIFVTNGTLQRSGIGVTNTFRNKTIWYVQNDKGTVSGSSTVTFSTLDGEKQKLTLGASVTIAFSGWATTGSDSRVEIELVNGAAGVTWPTVSWNVGTGTWSSSFPGAVALSTGTNFVKVWSTNGGTTVYGSAM